MSAKWTEGLREVWAPAKRGGTVLRLRGCHQRHRRDRKGGRYFAAVAKKPAIGQFFEDESEVERIFGFVDEGIGPQIQTTSKVAVVRSIRKNHHGQMPGSGRSS